jgi:replication fork clamp-binding protein CrfC
MVEISRWRHAVINFPHPLLRQGLVILDTPGLNAIGTEPELTLRLIPDAHVVVFVLAADAGVTKSDLDLWRSHVGAGHRRGCLAVLNKIDGLWDPLKSSSEIASEISRQVVRPRRRWASRNAGLPGVGAEGAGGQGHATTSRCSCAAT